MFAKLIIEMEAVEPKEKVNFSFSSLMQGVLMEYIDPKYAEVLHVSGLNPYTQHIEWDGGRFFWVITTMTEVAKKEIIDPLLKEEVKELYLKYKDLTFQIKRKYLETRSYENLMEETYFGSCSPYLSLEFVSPTAFKVDGKYQFYPTIRHIFKSLSKKHDSLDTKNRIFSEEVMEEIEKHVEITGYRLRSIPFYLEGVKIPAFMGTIQLRIHGPLQFINLIHMLAEIGTYSGVGIKTAIGMGAVRLVKKDSRGEKKIG